MVLIWASALPDLPFVLLVLRQMDKTKPIFLNSYKSTNQEPYFEHV
ncbi:hypothetical protein [Moraxella caviae]|nr:hypothetical protein [Moraxella caviae]